MMLGPALTVRGGVSRVEAISLEALSGRVDIRHVATMVDGPAAARLACFARAVLATLRELAARRDTVFHVHFASRGSTLRKGLLAALVVALGGRLFLHAHGGGFREFHAGLPRIARGALHALFRRSLRFAVLSEGWGRFYADACGVDPARIVVLRNPVVVPERPLPRPPRDGATFLFLGRVSESKGAFDLVRAFARLPREVAVRCRIVLAGDGALDALAAAAAGLGVADRVEVRDWVDAAGRDRLLAEADVFVLPSYREGIPMAMLEAMATGMPVIGTPVGGVPEILTDEVGGRVVTPGDVAGLARTMAQLACEPETRVRLGRDARAVAERFDARRYAQHLVDAYSAVRDEVRGRRGAPGGG
jgi:glycosyltransferase involved in cell wall biosynthesis